MRIIYPWHKPIFWTLPEDGSSKLLILCDADVSRPYPVSDQTNGHHLPLALGHIIMPIGLISRLSG